MFTAQIINYVIIFAFVCSVLGLVISVSIVIYKGMIKPLLKVTGIYRAKKRKAYAGPSLKS